MGRRIRGQRKGSGKIFMAHNKNRKGKYNEESQKIFLIFSNCRPFLPQIRF